jgi:hypothetical protein
MYLPSLLPESQVRMFKFYWEGNIRSGMLLKGQLYALLDCYPEDKRTIAFERGCEFAAHHEVVLTLSQDNSPVYRLWLSLRLQSDQQLLKNTHRILANTISSPQRMALQPRA